MGVAEKKSESREKLSWKERAGRILKLSGVPVALAMFLASCGGTEKHVSNEVLKDAKEKGEAVTISSENISDLESIIEKAKADQKTLYVFEGIGGNEERVVVDTTGNMVELESYVNLKTEESDMSYKTTDAFSVEDNIVNYNSYRGADAANSFARIEADKETGVITKAVADMGAHDELYGINNEGAIIGSKDAAKKATDSFSKSINEIKEKLQVK